MSTQNSTGNLLPHMCDIDVFGTPKRETNWDSTFLVSTRIFRGNTSSNGNQNDEITWDVTLAPGTWTVELLHATGTDRGFYHVEIDGTEEGTLDLYGSTAYNVSSTLAGVVITEGGVKDLTIKMASKNASSTNYRMAMNGLYLRRTA